MSFRRPSSYLPKQRQITQGMRCGSKAITNLQWLHRVHSKDSPTISSGLTRSIFSNMAQLANVCATWPGCASTVKMNCNISPARSTAGIAVPPRALVRPVMNAFRKTSAGREYSAVIWRLNAGPLLRQSALILRNTGYCVENRHLMFRLL